MQVRLRLLYSADLAAAVSISVGVSILRQDGGAAGGDLLQDDRV